MNAHDLLETLRQLPVRDFDSLGAHLGDLTARLLPPAPAPDEFLERVARGCAFVTFAYGIDGVSMEIAKYGAALAALLQEEGQTARLHCVGGNFLSRADQVIDPTWKRTVLANGDGWDKWEGGKWFKRLFRQDMPAGSRASRKMARTIWAESLRLAEDIADFVEREEIGLLIPVNVNSNPGNFALSLAMVVTSEVTGCPVLNNCHDYYWEGGGPTEERSPGRHAGPRDHFFRNYENEAFFTLFRRLLPWNGRRWIHVNINPLQSQHLVEENGIAADRTFVVGTGIGDRFFRECSAARKRENRRRLTHILADGASPIRPVPAEAFLARTKSWIHDQRPIACGLRGDQMLDLASEGTLLLVQPTRIVPRKCIERDWDLVDALLHHGPFRAEFARRPDLKIVVHVTGPVPIEHRADLDRVLESFVDVLASLPEELAARLFQSFSVGRQSHPSLAEDLDIVDLYQSADLIVFPSETEGRGLPIPESAAAGVPLLCCRYDPEEVFVRLVGEHLPAAQRLRFLEFPDGRFDAKLLDAVATRLLDPGAVADDLVHNREVVRARFSRRRLQSSFREYLDRLARVTDR